MIDFDLALEFLGRQLGIETLRLDEAGLCRLQVGEGFIDLQRTVNGKRLLLSSIAGELPDAGREVYLGALLAANAFFSGTGGATIGVPAGSTAVVLCRDVTEYASTNEGLLPIIEQFFRAMERVAELLTPPAAEDAPISDVEIIRV